MQSFKRLHTTLFVIPYNSEMFMSHFYDESLDEKQDRIIGRHAGIIGRTTSIKEWNNRQNF